MKDYATSTVMVGPSPSNSGTSLTVQTGHGDRFPDVPFKASIYPQNEMPTLDNAEKVLVTAKSSDTFTIERAKSPTTAKYIQPGDIISNSLFAEDIQDSAYKVWLSLGNEGTKQDFIDSLKGDTGNTGPIGPTGPEGPASTVPGPMGPNGLDGDMWYNGTGDPSTGLGKVGDFYLEVLTGNVYEKIDSTTWTIVSNIKGPGGSGSGDMVAATYDPAGGSRQVAFADELGSGDHGALTGLLDDDHPQYHNDTRGDARYNTKAEITAALSGKANSSHTHGGADITGTGKSGTTFLRGDNTWVVPTNTTYTEITEAEITAGTATTLRTITGRRVQFIKDWATAAIATMKAALTKSDVGLSNVDNTSDVNKPVSTAQQTALNAKENTTNKSTSTSLGTSDTLFPTQNAVKSYVDSKVSQDWWEELGAANLTGSSVTVPITAQKKFMKVIVAGTPNIPSADQLRVRANNAAFNVFVINLASTYTSGSAPGADYYWNGASLNGQNFMVETSVATGSGRAKFNTIAASADGIVRHSSAEMTTVQAITSFTAWYPGSSTFSGGRMVVLGHD